MPGINPVSSSTTTTTTTSAAARSPQRPAVTIDDFQKLSSGKYNAGNIVLTSKGKLDIANNHRHWTCLNTEKIGAEEAFDTRAAFARALKESGVSDENMEKAYKRLGIYASDEHGKSYHVTGTTAFTPLTRQEVREIIDACIGDINANRAPGSKALRTDAEIHSRYSQAKVRMQANVRAELNAAAGRLSGPLNEALTNTLDVLFKEDFSGCSRDSLLEMRAFVRDFQAALANLSAGNERSDIGVGRHCYLESELPEQVLDDRYAPIKHAVFVMHRDGEIHRFSLGDADILAFGLVDTLEKIQNALGEGPAEVEDQPEPVVEDPPEMRPEEPPAPPRVDAGPVDAPRAGGTQVLDYKWRIEHQWMSSVFLPEQDFSECPLQEIVKTGDFLRDVQPKLQRLLDVHTVFTPAEEDFEFGHAIPLDGYANHALAINGDGVAGIVVTNGGEREFLPLGTATDLRANFDGIVERLDAAAERILDRQHDKPVIRTPNDFKQFIQHLSVTAQFGGEVTEDAPVNDGYGQSRKIFTYQGFVFRCAEDDSDAVFAGGFRSVNSLDDPTNLQEAMGLGEPQQDEDGIAGYMALGATGENGVSTAKTIGQSIPYLQPRKNPAPGSGIPELRKIYVIDTTKLPGGEKAWDLDAIFYGNDFHRISGTRTEGEVNISSVPPEAVVGCVVPPPGDFSIMNLVQRNEKAQAVALLGGFEMRLNPHYAA